MFRPPSLRARLLAAVWLIALAAPAAAQDGTAGSTSTTSTNASKSGSLVIRALSVGDEEVKLGEIPVGIAECKDNAVIKFEIDGVPENYSVDVYLGEGCNQTSRNDTNNNNCDYIRNFKGGQTRELPLELSASDLIGDCEKEQESTPKLWFLAVKNPGGAEDVGKNYGMIESLRLDTRRPTAPTSVKGGSGEKQIPVEWETNESDLKGFVVLIDNAPTDGSSGSTGTSGTTGGGASGDEDAGAEPSGGGRAANGECGSSTLTPGASPDGLPSRIKRKEVNEATATGMDLNPGDLDSDSAAIAVVAVDEANNQSVISEIACVKVVPTESFWDRYHSDPNAVDAGCPCTALGPAQLQSAWPIALALGLCALSARRRRRS